MHRAAGRSLGFGLSSWPVFALLFSLGFDQADGLRLSLPVLLVKAPAIVLLFGPMSGLAFGLVNGLALCLNLSAELDLFLGLVPRLNQSPAFSSVLALTFGASISLVARQSVRP